MNEFEIQKLIYQHTDIKSNRLHVPNIYLYNWESDFIVVRNSGYIAEFEVKTSIVDFRKDFKKTSFSWQGKTKVLKHDLIEQGNGPNYLFYVMPLHVWEKAKHIIPPWCGALVIHSDKEGNWPVIEQEARLIHTHKVTDQQVMKILMSTYYRFMNKYKNN